MAKGWLGTLVDECNLCKGSYNGKMYDARLPASGQWANVCHSCFVGEGCKLGTGRGQEYTKQLSDGAWLKTGG